MRALGAAEHGIDGGKDARAILLELVEGAGGGQTFQHALVDRARIDAGGEIGKVGELALAARGDDLLHRLLADALERGQRIDDGVVLHLELDAGAVDRRRIEPDAEALGLGAEFGELVGVADVERHGRGEELDREIRLHIGGLIGDQRVSGGVALVEAVFGEALEQVEDGVGLIALDAALDAAGRRSARAAPASPS